MPLPYPNLLRHTIFFQETINYETPKLDFSLYLSYILAKLHIFCWFCNSFHSIKWYGITVEGIIHDGEYIEVYLIAYWYHFTVSWHRLWRSTDAYITVDVWHSAVDLLIVKNKLYCSINRTVNICFRYLNNV